MVKKRWYDTDPTLSMAVSLLYNASRPDQVKTADYIFKLLEQQGALGEHQLGKTITISYLFPFTRREKLEQTTWRLLEILKHLPKDLQLEMALNMIQFIYKLDSGLDLSVEEAEARLRAQLKSG